MAKLITRKIPVTTVKVKTTNTLEPIYCKIPVETDLTISNIAYCLGVKIDTILTYESIGTAVQQFSMDATDFIRNSIEEKGN